MIGSALILTVHEVAITNLKDYASLCSGSDELLIHIEVHLVVEI
jgi:hypothetical protein